MLFIIGLGLNIKGISLEGIEAIKKSKEIYLESYTISYPYNIKELEKVIKRKTIILERSGVEEFKFLNNAKKRNIALLVYGNPLIATTHISLIEEAKKRKIKTEVIHSGSILDAVGETGLQVYKFGKIASIPKWEEKNHYTPNSFMEVLIANNKIKAHTLFLIDIGLEFKDCLSQLIKSSEPHGIKINTIIIGEKLGNKDSKIYYGTINELKDKKIKFPYCIIIPSELHFAEKEYLEKIN